MQGCRARLVWLLVLSLAWLGPVLGGEEEDGEVVAEEEEEEEEEDVVSDELGEEDGVLVLHEHNFARALSEHRLLLVEFCECPPSAGRAAALRNESSPVRLGKVDATAQAALANEFGITSYPTLKLFRDGNRTHPLAYTGRMDTEGIVRWMRRRAGPSTTLLQDTLVLREGSRAPAGAFRGEVLFVVVDVTGYGADVLPFFGLTPAEIPTLRLVKMENNRKYRMDQDSFSDTAIRTFVQAVLDGKVKPHLLSADPPEDWDARPVKVLVGKTFEQVAFDETKNVFVKFWKYAPWCSHCQAMAAAWEELGERYKDHEDIVIAELDATANELETLTINGFPTLHYFPAGPGRRVPETPENSTDGEEPSPPGTAETRDEL
ncbi:protein disulfide-isomerase A2 [Egretta garzetta]|uniref:protein disulfide-isomerase A2 n=1 Tax=Egretta garzetta TaxID=188379 RepID=UPI00163C7C03|nr:protein disulfide-isomerase A2 [Egretta garzetta]